MRPSGRSFNELRKIEMIPSFSKHAEGSCLVKFGDTHVLCTASLEEKVPPFMKGSGKGWVTAEYGMLPRSTGSRMDREAARGGQSGRTQEIQRLIGRSLRSITNMAALGERQVRIDCDVIQADGGTRTAAITGSYIALYQAFLSLKRRGVLAEIPLTQNVAAISCGIYEGNAVLDLDYAEDSTAQADANFVMSGDSRIIEIQGTAEESPFTQAEFLKLLAIAEKGILELVAIQNKVIQGL